MTIKTSKPKSTVSRISKRYDNKWTHCIYLVQFESVPGCSENGPLEWSVDGGRLELRQT